MGQVSNLKRGVATLLRCIVFDFDGVLIDSNEIKRRAYFEIFASFPNSADVLEQCLTEHPTGHRYQIIESILQAFEANGILRPDRFAQNPTLFLAERYNRICETYANRCREIPGASDCLARLTKRYRLYINSTTLQDPLRRIVNYRGWGSYFRKVLGSPRGKIDNLKWIVKRERLDGKEVLCVGDSQGDWAAAKALECHFIGIRNRYNDFRSSPVVLLEDLNHLEEAILRMERKRSDV